MEESIARISSKVADAIEMTQQAAYLSQKSERIIKEIGLALEELVVSMDEVNN